MRKERAARKVITREFGESACLDGDASGQALYAPGTQPIAADSAHAAAIGGAGDTIWDAGWATEVPGPPPTSQFGARSEVTRPYDHTRPPSHSLVSSSLGALAHLGVAHSYSGRIERVRALARRRPASAVVLGLFLLGFLLTCFAPLIPILRLGYDVYDASRRVTALREMVAGNPARLMQPGVLSDVHSQVAEIENDLYEINGAMNVLGAPLAASNTSLRNYRLLVRLGLELTAAANDGLQSARAMLQPVEGGFTTSANAAAPGITRADLQQARQSLDDARGHLLSAYAIYQQLDQSELPSMFKPPAPLGKLLTMLPAAISATDQAQTLLDAAPALLGIGQPAYYLVVAMDSTELRPGGGFIGNYGILALTGGRQDSSLPLALHDTYPLDQKYYQNALEPYRILQSVPSVTRVKGCASLGPQPPAIYWWWPYRAFDTTCRYGWGLRDSNLSASFPQNAQMMMRIVSETGGVVPGNAPLQGVIALTPGLIQELLQVTGPIQVPQFNVTVNANNLEDMIHKYQLTGARPQSGDRKEFTHLLSAVMLDTLKSLHGNALGTIVKAGVNALKSKDLQVYFADPTAESMLRQLGYASELRTDGVDGFMVVDANDGGNKANAYVTEKLTDVVTLLPNGGAIHHLRIAVTYDKGLRSVYPGNSRQDDYSDFQRTYLPGTATIRGVAGFNPNTYLPVGCGGSGVRGYGSIISACARKYAIINPVTTSDYPGRMMVGGALLVLCGQYSTFRSTSLEYPSCEKTPKAHTQTIYISWYTPNAYTQQADGHGTYTEVVEQQAGNTQSLTVTIDMSQLRAAQPAMPGASADAIVTGATPTIRAAAFARLLDRSVKIFAGPLDHDQTVSFGF
jgi:Protein of unknown function (DUF4012)